MLKVDLHLHSKKDEQEHFIDFDEKKLIDRAAELGFDAIAFTFHDKFIFEKNTVEYAREKGIILIPGMEKAIEKRHVLILNIREDPDIKRLSELRKLPSSALVIAPHPYYPYPVSLMGKLKKHLKHFHAIEYSSFYCSVFNIPNKKAQKFAEDNNMPLVGNTDCHLLRQFGRTYTMVDANKNIDSIIRAIKQDKIMLITEPQPLFGFVFSVFRSSIMAFYSLFGLRKA